ncbi:MAG: 50S ribosomal protein L15e [bacterium]|nr:50S ribosomal protein L15e [bacterium]
MGFYKYISEAYRDRAESYVAELMKQRLVEWREQPAVVRIERPTRLDRARRLGWKPIPGIIVVRVRVRKGAAYKTRPRAGRKPKTQGVNKITRHISDQVIAEQRAARKFPNMEVLASYYITEDGNYKWFEVILVDPYHPQIKARPEYAWICLKTHRRRVFRGLTPAGKKSRGLKNRSPQKRPE